jgi:hypothetical protein
MKPISKSRWRSDSSSDPFRIAYNIYLWFALVVTLATIAWLLSYSDFGIDLTDESYYLIWMSSPWLYSFSVSQFGFVYYPLYKLFAGDISLLRQANILMIFGLSWVLGFVYLQSSLKSTRPGGEWKRLTILIIAAVTAVSSLVYFCPHGWLVTPSYNGLAFKSVLLLIIGYFLADKRVTSASIIGWFLIGVGGWLLFMAKPTAAATVGVIIGVYLLLDKKVYSLLLLVPLGTSLALLASSALIIDGSLSGFVKRLLDGYEALSLLEAGHHNMIRLDGLFMGSKGIILLCLFVAMLIGTYYLTTSSRKILIIFGLGVITLFISICILIICGILHFPAIKYRAFHLTRLTLAIPLSVWAFYILQKRNQAYQKLSKAQVWHVILFALLPHAFAFGTNQNYWLQGSMQSFFWVLAGISMLIPLIQDRLNACILLPALVGCQLITVFLLQVSMEQPYWNQPEPFRMYDKPVAYGRNHSELMLPSALADYYRNLVDFTSQAGFSPGLPVIDMTGEGPGTLYAIDAKPIGQPWMMGGFPGSDKFAVFTLNRAQCKDIAESWLLVDPDSQSKLSSSVLKPLGLSIETNYQIAAEMTISGNSQPRHGMASHKLQLWKPVHQTSRKVRNCVIQVGHAQ